MDNEIKDKIEAILYSNLLTKRDAITRAFKNRHNGLLHRQNYIVVESAIREYRAWLKMLDIIDNHYFN